MKNGFWKMSIAAIVLVVFAWIGMAPVGLAQAVCDRAKFGAERVEKAPFSALRRVITITRKPDGTSSRDEATQSEARDGKGRTYSAGEGSWSAVIGNERVQKSEILVRISDPVANTSIQWDTTSKKVKVFHWPQQTSKTGTEEGPSNPFLSTPTLGADVQDLGTKTIEGVLAEGFRVSDTAPSAQPNGDNQTVVVHECWYSPELKVVILEIDNDARRGSFTNQLENIVRGEPDVARYQPPASYVRQYFDMPPAP